MKCVIMEHKGEYSYVMDTDGVFHAVQGCTALPVGSEIVLDKYKKKSLPTGGGFLFGILRTAAAVMFCVMLGGYVYIFSNKLTDFYSPDNSGEITINEENTIPLAPNPPGFEEPSEKENSKTLEVTAIIISAGALAASGGAVFISLSASKKVNRKSKPAE